VDEYDPTIEDSYRKQCVIDDEVALLDVLNTAGQEEYSAMREQYTKTGEGFLLVYSITSRTSFDEIKTLRHQILWVKGKDYWPILLVGNHCERDIDRVVSVQEGRELAREFQCRFCEVSAKERINVDRPFHDIVREIRRYNRAITSQAITAAAATGIKNSSQSATFSSFLERFRRLERLCKLRRPI